MKTISRAALLSAVALAWIVGSAALPAAQEPAVARPVLTPAQMEDFLLHAKIIKMKVIGKGVTLPRRATLSDGQMTHDAKIQIVNESKVKFEGTRGTELNFRDYYGFNVTGYRLARLLGLDNVPVNVERRVEGTTAAVEWWLDDFLMDENDRQKKHTSGPDPERTAKQTHIMRVFD